MAAILSQSQCVKSSDYIGNGAQSAMWLVWPQFVAEIETSILSFPKLEADTVHSGKLCDDYQPNNVQSELWWKLFHKRLI